MADGAVSRENLVAGVVGDEGVKRILAAFFSHLAVSERLYVLNRHL